MIELAPRSWIFWSVMALAMCGVVPTQAWEWPKGGYLVDYERAINHAAGPHRLNGWYNSAEMMWLGYRGTCIVPGSDTILIAHPVTDRVHGKRAVTWDNPWGYIVSPAYFQRVISRTPWGAAVFADAQANGCFTSPAPCNYYADQLIWQFGVPVCR